MTDGHLMDADCIHGVAWYECAECAKDDPRPPDGPQFISVAVRDALADIEARRSDDRCECGWGDFRCIWTAGHDGAHSLAWDGDEDDE